MKENILKAFNNDKQFTRGLSQFAWVILWAHLAAIVFEIVKPYLKYW